MLNADAARAGSGDLMQFDRLPCSSIISSSYFKAHVNISNVRKHILM